MNAKKWSLVMGCAFLGMPLIAIATTTTTAKLHSPSKKHVIHHKNMPSKRYHVKLTKKHALKKTHRTAASLPSKTKTSELSQTPAASAASTKSSTLQQSLAAILLSPFTRSKTPESSAEPAPSFTMNKSLTNSLTQRLTQFAYETVNTFTYSTYKFGGTYFDLAKGIYILDCSSYVDSILRKAYPNAYRSLVNATGADRPTTSHYYDFFSNLSSRSKQYWRKVEQVGQLRPGDIIVFRTKNKLGNESGHVMIVMDKPVSSGNNAFAVRVADSAPNPHSLDTRAAHQSGIGIGTFVLKTDPHTYEPFAYAWSIGARFKKNVNFAMARPVTID